MKKCLHCEAEMPDEEHFCSECGKEFMPNAEDCVSVADDALETGAAAAEPDVVPDEDVGFAAPVAEKSEHKKKIKWWHIVVPVFFIVAIAAGLLLGPFFIYLAPEVVLAKALAATASDLSARVEGTPLAIVEKAYDESQKNTMTMDIDISQPLAGEMHLGMDAKVDGITKQTSLGIQVDGFGQELAMNLYMDREVAAVNMDLITGKNYYGIYYDTFGEDIRDNEFLYATIREENIVILEEIVDVVDQMMNLDVVTPEQQAESLKQYANVVLEFVSQRDAQITNGSVSVDGKEKNCKILSFALTNQDYAQLMLKLLDVAENDPVAIYYYKANTLDYKGEGWQEILDSERRIFEELKNQDDEGTCVISFCLYGGKVVQIGVAYYEPGNSGHFNVTFGKDASVSDIVLSGEIVEGEARSNFDITLSTQKEGDVVTEWLYITAEEEGEEPFHTEIGYEWDRESGDMCVYFQREDEKSYEVECILTELDNGYRFAITSVDDLLKSAGIATWGFDVSFDVSVTAGAEIEVPNKIKDIAKLTKLDMLKIAANLMDM